MDFFLSIILVMVASVEIQGKNLHYGPQIFNNTGKLPVQSNPKRYATKEIILYLTPSQIRALQEGKGQINPLNIPHVDSEKHAYEHAQALAAHQEQNQNIHQHLAHPQPLKVPPVEEPHSDHFVPIIPPPHYRQSDNFAYINFHPQHQQHIPKSVPFFPEAHEQVTLNGQTGLPLLIPHERHHDPGSNSLKDNLKDQWHKLLDQNRAHFKALAALSQYNIERDSEHKKDLLQYAPKYNDQKYSLDFEHLISKNHQLQLEKQQAQLQAEAIANSPPVVVHKEISINHSPVHLIKQVKVPVPAPVLIPVPEPFEVKVPQPYPVPLEIIRPVAVPIVKTQKIEIDRPVPIEFEKHIPFPVTKNVFVNVERPYFVDRLIPLDIPVHNSNGLPSHHHVWNH